MNKSKDNIVENIHKARIELHNERKNLTIDEKVKQAQERAKIYIEKYGFEIASPSSSLLSKAQ